MKGYREISAAGRTIGIVLIDEAVILFFHLFFLYGYYGTFQNIVEDISFLNAAIQLMVVRPIIKIVYFCATMVMTNGKTIGLYFVNGRLKRDNMQSINLLTVLGWYLPASLGRRIPLVGIIIGATNVLMVFFNKRKKAIGDYTVNTTIVVDIPNDCLLEKLDNEPFVMLNSKNNKLISSRCYAAIDVWERAIGLHAFRNAKNVSLLLLPCSRIHTFFLEHSIDILFIDKDGVVCGLVSNSMRNKLYRGPINTSAVIELPSGCIDSVGIEAGDRIQIASKP